MRKQRQDIKLLKDGGADEDDIIAARCRYRGTSAEYVRFSKTMKLPQQRERVYMDGLGNIGQGKYKLSVDKTAKSDIVKAGHKLAERKAFSFVDYSNVVNPKSVQRFKATAEKLGYQYVKGIDTLTDGRAARAILRDVEKLSKQYEKRFSSISIVDFGDEKTIAETVLGELRLNSKFMNKPDALRDVLNGWERTNFIPKGCNTIRYVSDHEYFHLLTQNEIDNPHSKIVTEVKRAINNGCEPVSENSALNGIHEFVADLLSSKNRTTRQKTLKDKINLLIGGS